LNNEFVNEVVWQRRHLFCPGCGAEIALTEEAELVCAACGKSFPVFGHEEPPSPRLDSFKEVTAGRLQAQKKATQRRKPWLWLLIIIVFVIAVMRLIF
jgi:uncharacterized membrane protein YvbJ